MQVGKPHAGNSLQVGIGSPGGECAFSELLIDLLSSGMAISPVALVAYTQLRTWCSQSFDEA